MGEGRGSFFFFCCYFFQPSSAQQTMVLLKTLSGFLLFFVFIFLQLWYLFVTPFLAWVQKTCFYAFFCASLIPRF